jgi:hypothetical protein
MRKVLVGLAMCVVTNAALFNVHASDPDKTVRVAANKGWQGSALSLGPDDDVQIDYAEGEWAGNKQDKPRMPVTTGPKGSGCFPAPFAPSGALIARIGNGRPFLVGESSGRMSGRGEVFLRMNDCDQWLSDNSGSVRVNIYLYRAVTLPNPDTRPGR